MGFIRTTVSMAVIALICVSFSQPAFAKDDSELVVTPYLWAAGLNGDVTVNGNPAEVDLDFSDVFEDLDSGGGMVHVESRRERWGAFFDLTYAKLASDGDAGPFSVDVETETALVELGAFYRLLESSDDRPLSLDVLGGGRYIYLKGELDIKGAGPLGVDIEVDTSKDWVDAIVGGRIQLDFTEQLTFSLRGDAGGFGVGSSSELTWNVVAALGYELSERTTLWLGYRHLDIDYDDGSGSNLNEYDVEMTGPMLGLAIGF